MEIFYINKGATLPNLRVELVKDGKNDFMKSYQFNNGLQNANVSFSMWNDKGQLEICKASCDIIESNDSGCERNFILQYRWKKRDTVKEGQYLGKFEITFNDDIHESGVTYDSGNLIVPLYEDLIIMIKD